MAILHMTANENRMSKLAESFLNSPLSYRYYFDRCDNRRDQDPGVFLGSFLYKGLLGVNKLEKVATQAAKKMFGAQFVDFRPLSGIHAMMETIISATRVGDIVYTIPREIGGHFTTGPLLTMIGRRHREFPYKKPGYTLDINKFAAETKKEKPKLIYFDTSYHLFPYDLKEIRKCVDSDTIMIYDASHTLGLIAGGQFQNPLKEGCDILQGNTHKTFPGPQKAMILFKNKKIKDKIEKGIDVGLVSSQHTHHAIALYITILEMEKFGKNYAIQTIKNAQELGRQLKQRGFLVYARDNKYTSSHTIIIADRKLKAKTFCTKLFQAGISTNTISAFDFDGIRMGSQEVTRRGMKEKDMATIANFYKRIASRKESLSKLRREVIKFNNRFNNICYSFSKNDL